MMRVLKFAGISLVAIIVVLLILFLYVQASWEKVSDQKAPVMVAPKDSATIAAGEHIFKNTWQCWGCHAEGSPDADTPPSGGRKFDLSLVGPGFGTFYSRNLTPDIATGLGSWTDGEIVQAIREGVRKDRRYLFPLMPVDWLKGMSDDDVLAVVAYLRSLPPVKNRVPDAEPSFVAKALLAFNVIKPLPALTGPVVAPPRGITPEYGKYAAENLAGCADCHTPRNLQNGEFYLDSLFSGSSVTFGEDAGSPMRSYARNLRRSPGTGGPRLTEDQFLAAVTFGLRPDSTILLPHMPYAYYKFIPEKDLRAIYRYIVSLTPVERETPAPWQVMGTEGVSGVDRGSRIFRSRCAECHGVNGKGAKPTNVQLAEVTSSLTDKDLRDFIATGQPSLKMPPFGKTLTEEELSDLIVYIRSWAKQ